MNVTINDAINAFNLLREHVNENGFLHECYNLGISALKTIQDGNYQLPTTNVSRETLEAMANFKCEGLGCSDCIYAVRGKEGYHECMSLKAKDMLLSEQNRKEVEAWVNHHTMNL